MTKSRATIIAGAAVALLLLAVFVPRRKERQPACAQTFTYEVVSRSHGGSAPGLASAQVVRAEMRWEPVAGSGKPALFKVRPSKVVLEGFPEEMKRLAPQVEEVVLYVELSDEKEALLWAPPEDRPAFAANVAKILVDGVRFQRRSGTVKENDVLGELSVKYTLHENTLSREKLRYEKMHHASPVPDILESSGSYEWARGFLPESAKSTWRHAQQLEPSGKKVEISGEVTASVREKLALEPPALSHCASTVAAAYLRERRLASVPWAMDVGKPAADAPVTRTTEDLLKTISKEKESSSSLDDLSARLEQHPGETGRVRRALEKLSGNEERSAWLISVLANAHTPEAQAALREMIDFYLSGGKARLAIRVMRAQQLSDYVDAASVENLVRLSESRSVPPRVRQAALFAAGGAAAVLGDDNVSRSLRQKWEGRAADGSAPKERAEYLSALGNLAAEESVPFLIEVARKEGDLVGTQAIDALRLIRTPEAQRELVEIGTRDSSEERRRAALHALEFRPFSEETCAQLVPHYRALLQQHGSSRAAERMQILSALGQPGHQNYETVLRFLGELKSDGRLTKQENEFLTQLETVGFQKPSADRP